MFYHIPEGSSKEKVQSALYSFGLVSRGAEARPVVGSVASLVRVGLLGVEQYMPVFSHKVTSHFSSGKYGSCFTFQRSGISWSNGQGIPESVRNGVSKSISS